MRLLRILISAAIIWPTVAFAQVLPSVNQPTTQAIDIPSHREAVAAQILDTTGHVIGTVASPLVVSCPDGSCAGAGAITIGTVTQGNAGSGTQAWFVQPGTGATFPVSGTFWQATQPVSATSLPLPSGAATAAKQPSLGVAGTASADVLSVQGEAGMTPIAVTGTFWPATQPVSGSVSVSNFPATQAVFSNAGSGIVPRICQSKATVGPSTATDTLLVDTSIGKNIYICDFSASMNGTQDFYLESATGAGCTGSLAQVGTHWYGNQYWGKNATRFVYTGENVGSGNGLCLHTGQSQTMSLTVTYDQS